MAQSKNNIITHGLSGKVGDIIVFSQRGGKTIVSKAPRKRTSEDSEKQKEIVMQLVDDCGFDSYDNGNLANSWTQQPCSAGYCCDYTIDELREVKAKSSQTTESVTQNRKEMMNNFVTLADGDFSHENTIKINRKYHI